jgi:hypothetical protein
VSLLEAAVTQRPVAVQNVLRVDADDEGDDEAVPALAADLDEQEQLEDQKRNSRLKAEKMLQSVMGRQTHSVQDVGKAPKPTVIAQSMEQAPASLLPVLEDSCRTNSIHHFARHNPERVQRATDDAANSIDVMIKLNSADAYSGRLGLRPTTARVRVPDQWAGDLSQAHSIDGACRFGGNFRPHLDHDVE